MELARSDPVHVLCRAAALRLCCGSDDHPFQWVPMQIFRALEVPGDQYTCVNILEDESLRAGLKEYSMVRQRAPSVLRTVHVPHENK